MRANPGTDSKPELAVRRLLHRDGLRFRKHLAVKAGTVRVRPDIVFTRRRVAVFIDGCFWHCCPQHGNQPIRNSSYWSAKLARNKARDARVNEALVAEGWTVLRFWEHQPATMVAAEVARTLARRSCIADR